MLPSELWDEYVTYDSHGTTFMHASGSACRILTPMCKAINEVFMKKWNGTRPILKWDLTESFEYANYTSWCDDKTKYVPAGTRLDLVATNSDFYDDKHWTSQCIRAALVELDQLVTLDSQP